MGRDRARALVVFGSIGLGFFCVALGYLGWAARVPCSDLGVELGFVSMAMGLLGIAAFEKGVRDIIPLLIVVGVSVTILGTGVLFPIEYQSHFFWGGVETLLGGVILWRLR
jgi:uncharacterized membrane protein YgaE (UPF0421/DUF939 family)